ncbi:MAG TPA: HGGxSTG domain-containing protein [Noviherbaspirillum sp.]|uniref:HGGxSTG domain-containing protein n=1 Tax=Noviherbaspirillum sp. TaxID=1926288 RepID=UPI002DDD670F|nr:HGGxSTG domain-containing protein [Noviherbaspirillum sp.]HEV2610618.1 HGGxSTG domain-containing protein [Noviherbaspirillum sp.]
MQLHAAARCGAKTRSGAPCMGPAVQGKRRCRMHGGNSPGAPKGNRNALKHGQYSARALELRRKAAKIRRELAKLVKVFE